MHNLGVTLNIKCSIILRVGHDRHLYPAWRSKYLVDLAKARDNPKPSKYNMDSALSRAGAVRRVRDEYTVRDKVRYVLTSSLTLISTGIIASDTNVFHILVVYPVERRQYTLDHRGDAQPQERIPSF